MIKKYFRNLLAMLARFFACTVIGFYFIVVSAAYFVLSINPFPIKKFK